MPELPEVETVRRGLANRLDNFYIEEIEVCRERSISSPGGPKLFRKALKGLVIGDWERRGKYLIASLLQNQSRINPGEKEVKISGHLGVHLRMTGYFQWHRTPSPPCPHTRVRFWNQKGEELRFVDVRSFGQLWWVPPNQSIESVITGLKSLGPEPFSNDFNISYLQKKLENSRRPIKSALLDQSLVAGTGNIYADESLFLAGIRPQTPSFLLKKPRLQNLLTQLVEVLKTSIGKGGTTFSDFRDLNGLNGNYGQEAWVYGRGKKPCRKCGTEIRKVHLSGRGTHWCPKCQS